MHGSRFTSRPGRSNDDVVCFDASFWGNCVCISLFQQWLERAKKLNDWLWPPKKRCTYVFHCPFHFKLSLRSRLVFGSQIINYLSKKIRSSLHISRISFSSAAPHTFLFFRWISIRRGRCFPLFKWSKCKQNSFSRHCSAYLSAMKVWVNTEHAQQSFTASASRGQHLSAFIRNLLRRR